MPPKICFQTGYNALEKLFSSATNTYELRLGICSIFISFFLSVVRGRGTNFFLYKIKVVKVISLFIYYIFRTSNSNIFIYNLIYLNIVIFKSKGSKIL